MDVKSLYSTLPGPNSIRLLQLHPGPNDSVLECSLLGNAHETTIITCNNRPFSVTTSLYAALHRLRQRNKDLIIWVDAVYINQADVRERNHQVMMMQQIYSNAFRVFIWAGHGNQHNAAAIKAARKIAFACSTYAFPSETIPTSSLGLSHSVENKSQLIDATRLLELEDVLPEDYTSLNLLFQNEWFRRVWVIQEVRGTSNVHFLCVVEEVEWAPVAITANWIQHVYDRDPTTLWRLLYFPSFIPFDNVFFMWDSTFKTRRDAPFLALLQRTRDFRASDARDKVFALLHHPIVYLKNTNAMDNSSILLPVEVNHTHLDLEVDYGKSTSEIFLKVALNSIRCYNTLEVLSYAWRSLDYDPASPSWVPRWDLTDNTGSSPLATFLYCASGTSAPSYRLDANNCSLHVHGISIASVLATNIVLYCGELQPQDSEDNGQAMSIELSMLSEILVQDRTHLDTTQEISFMRGNAESSANNFADFAAFVLPLLEANEQGCYVSLISTWCFCCGCFMSKQRIANSGLDESWYYCAICDAGDFELCRSCYEKN